MRPHETKRQPPSRAAISDAVFKTFVEGALLIGLSVAHLAVGFSV